MKSNFAKKITAFFKKETVLSVAAVLAGVSMIFNPPSAEYAGYIDWNTLAMLFSLMAVMKGFQNAGVFVWLGNSLLSRTNTTRKVMLALVFLPFFFSMVITNDVSLITFVPFALVVLKMAGQERLIVPVVVLQTVAANLGSMMTPMGNPQNLYLYTQSGMSFGALVMLMLPYGALSAMCIALLTVRHKSERVTAAKVDVVLAPAKTLAVYGAGFALCLLALFDVLPPLALAAVVAAFLCFYDRKVLAQVDYALLGTFVAFFIFIGNLGGVGWFRDFIASILEGRVVLVSALASQVISNVPAALLLSGFTQDWNGLLIGTNIGGLGTLIASMASLISYKQVARSCPQSKKAYFVQFTLVNAAMLVLLLAVSFALA